MQPDSEWMARLRSSLRSRHPRFAVATVAAGEAAVGCTGIPPEADFEIGSVSKAITRLHHADACDRGEIRPEDTTLGELLPLGDCPAAHVTLSAVSRHSSGLPTLPKMQDMLKRTYAFWRHGRNPYGEDLAELLLQAQRVRLKGARPRYSNLGFELLGHAVAAGAGVSYRDLLADRLRTPLGLTSTYGPLRPVNLALMPWPAGAGGVAPGNPGSAKRWARPAASGRPSATWPPLPAPSWTAPRQESQPSIRP